jgi:transposase
MSRRFKTADYAATLEVQVRLGDCLPPEHLARFVVDTLGLLDLSAIYEHYGPKGGQPYAPPVLVGLLFYGYVTGVFSSRKLERATYESIPMRYVAGNLHPDHDTLAHFRRTFLAEIQEAFVQVLLVAQQVGVLEVGVVSQDGTKIPADASKSQAVSYERLLELEPRLRAEVAALFALAEQAEQAEGPTQLDVAAELALRQARLEQLALAKAVLEARAAERYATDQAEYEAKLAERAAKAARTGKRPGGKPPTPPTPGPRGSDQYNFTDPESRIMKNSTDAGFDQQYNAQLVVEQRSLLVVGTALSNHPNDQQEVAPTLDAIPPVVGSPQAVALDAGFFSAANIQACLERGIEPYIAPGREAHRQTLADLLAPAPVPPPEGASPRVQMAAKLRTPAGHAIYRARKCTVEPVIGIIKEVLGFRQFSLRGAQAAAGEWCLVCLAYNLKRLHTLLGGVLPSVALARAVPRTPLAPVLLLLLTLLPLVHVARRWFHQVFQHHHTAGHRWSVRDALPTLYAFSPTSC